MTVNYKEVGDGGVIYLRNSHWYARIAIGGGRYMWRSLKTSDESEATVAARDLLMETRFRVKHDLPVIGKSVSWMLDQWIQHITNLHSQNRYSSNMLRQHQRCAVFFREFAGNRTLEHVNDALLEGYAEWRFAYYQRNPQRIRRNVKPVPQAKSIQFELTAFKQVLKWAWARGWAGKTPLPTYAYNPKLERVRPAFELNEWREFYRTLRKWVNSAGDERSKRSRQQFRDFALLLANSGLRPGEAYNLQMRDIEPMKDSKGRQLYRLIVRGKTGHRDVIPRAIAARYIERQIARRQGAASTDYFFVNDWNQRLFSLSDAFDNVLAQTSFKRSGDGRKFSIYSFRHTYATFQIRFGRADVFLIARNMGTSVEMLQRFYGKQATPLSAMERLI